MNGSEFSTRRRNEQGRKAFFHRVFPYLGHYRGIWLEKQKKKTLQPQEGLSESRTRYELRTFATRSSIVTRLRRAVAFNDIGPQQSIYSEAANSNNHNPNTKNIYIALGNILTLHVSLCPINQTYHVTQAWTRKLKMEEMLCKVLYINWIHIVFCDM